MQRIGGMRVWVLVVFIAGCGAPSSNPATPSVDSGPEASTGGNIDASPEDAATSNDAAAGDSATVDAAPPPPPAPPAPYITTDDLSPALSPATLTMGDSANAGAVITLDPTTTYQAILGFGASITDSSSYVMT